MAQQHVTLEDVSEFIVDCLHKTAPTQENGYPLIRTPNIGRGRFKLDGVYRISEETYREWTARATPRANDLILAREAPAGNVAIIKEGQQLCLGQRTVLIRLNSELVDPHFLTYFLLAPAQQGLLLAGSTGVTVKHVNMRDIRKLPLRNLPNLEIQREIGGILSTYDDLIENNRRRIALLEEAARLLYREWFVHLRFPGHEHTPIADGVPQGWQRLQLGDKVVLNYGKGLKKDDRIAGPFNVFGSSGIVGTHTEALVEGPGIIVGRKGNVGSVFWSSTDFHPIDTVYFIDNATSSYYLFYVLQHTHFVSSDSAVPGLNRNYAYSRPYLIPLPEIETRFEELVTPMRRQIDNLTKYNEELRQARDLLLPRLMNGEITV